MASITLTPHAAAPSGTGGLHGTGASIASDFIRSMQLCGGRNRYGATYVSPLLVQMASTSGDELGVSLQPPMSPKREQGPSAYWALRSTSTPGDATSGGGQSSFRLAAKGPETSSQ